MSKIISVLNPIIHDIRTGTLKRVAKSTYVKRTMRSNLDFELLGDRADKDVGGSRELECEDSSEDEKSEFSLKSK